MPQMLPDPSEYFKITAYAFGLAKGKRKIKTYSFFVENVPLDFPKGMACELALTKLRFEMKDFKKFEYTMDYCRSKSDCIGNSSEQVIIETWEPFNEMNFRSRLLEVPQ